MLYWKLVWRNLGKHRLRSFLTLGGVMIGCLLLCTLQGVVTTLRTGAENASSRRLWVQSAVSLYVDLPLSYEGKIASVAGVEKVCKFQWFGGYYQDPSSFFAQFAVDPEEFLDMYPEVDLIDGSREAFLGRRTACIVGESLAQKFEWNVGGTIPLVGALFPNPAGFDQPWDFEIAGIYRPTTKSFDDRTLYFHWDYFEKTLEQSAEGAPGSGTYVLQVAQDVDTKRVMRDIDALFENGPQRVQTTTEAEFQAQFISMIGNVPFFVSWLGAGVLLAILVACVNTMLVSALEQVHDVGIMKALGFTSSTSFVILLGQSLLLCVSGGLIGIGLAKLMEGGIAAGLASMLPGFQIRRATILLAFALSVVLGLIAGILPAWRTGRMRVIDALGNRE